MNSIIMGGEDHYHSSGGFGDTKVNAIFGIWQKKRQAFMMNGGLSIPTGDINQSLRRADGAHGNDYVQIPLSNAIRGVEPGIYCLGATYVAQSDRFTFGAQLSSVLRTGENSNAYRYGNRFQLTSWGAYKTTDWLSFSVRGVGSHEGAMTGYDADLEPIMSPVNDPDNFGSEYIKVLGGFNIYIPRGTFSGLDIGFEFGWPVYQNVTGIQMKQTGAINAGIKYSLF